MFVPYPLQNSDYGVYDDAKEQLFCYSCSYHVRKGNVAGHENCRDPFIKTDIPEVPCSGTCAVSSSYFFNNTDPLYKDKYIYLYTEGPLQGSMWCRNPFIKTDIPEVPCSGTCAKYT